MLRGNIKDFFTRDRKALYMILGIVLISVFSLTIVYAALNVTLNITGNSEVVASTWDIHLDNIKVTSGSVSGNAPTITSPTTATFSTTLNNPGDFYEFTVDVVNGGSIDAMIDGVSKTPTLTTEQAKYLNYIIEYENGDLLNTKQLVSKNSFVRLKVRVEFRKDISASALPSTTETLNLAFTVNYVQSDGSGSEIPNHGVQLVKVISGDGTQVGDEVCIEEECFYVISSDEYIVTMISKLPINVVGVPKQSTLTSNKRTIFSSDLQKGENYSDYSGSIVEGIVNDYNSYLITLGVTPIETRIISKDELNLLGCSTWSCSNAPEWLCYVNKYCYPFWTNTVYDSSSVWIFYNQNVVASRSAVNYDASIRPVIIISKSEF